MRWHHSRALLIGGALGGVFVLAALLSFVWTPYSAEAMDIPNKLQPPGAAHWFGTDHFGRDILSMIMAGARISLAVAILAVGIGMGIGVPPGAGGGGAQRRLAGRGGHAGQ